MDQADDLTALFNRQPSGIEYAGPFDVHYVVLNGRQVPFLEASPADDGVHLTLDHRLGLQLSADEAERIIPFIADCIAVGMGYTCHPTAEEAGPVQRQPFPRTQGVRLLEG